jgi:protein SCO1/2
MLRRFPMRVALAVIFVLGSVAACGTRPESAPQAAVAIAVPAPAPALRLGDAVPDVPFRDQDDRPIRLSHYRGRVVAATFMYTRCPFPDYCPRLMARMNQVRTLLARDRRTWDRVTMIGITIDPDYDTPRVLRAYGEAMLGAAPFDHLALVTGERAQIDRLAASVGVTSRETSGQLTHTLATVLIDPGGRLANVIDGSDWSPEDVAAAIGAAARR